MLLYFVPLPANTLPVPGSAAAAWLDACKAHYRMVSGQRPRTAFVDRMVDDAFTRDIANFEDTTHMRNELAPVLEKDIAQALRPLISSRLNSADAIH